MIKKVLLPIGVLFSLFFSMLWGVSWMDSAWVKKNAAIFVSDRVEKEVKARMGEFDNLFLAGKMQRVLKAHSPEIAAAKEMLSKQIIAAITEAQTEKPAAAPSEPVRDEGRFATLSQMKNKIQTLVREQYLAVTKKLLREFRIVTGVNAGVFILFSVLLGFQRKNASALLAPALLLLPAALVTILGYLLAQNWLYTLLFNDYVGYAYLVYFLAALLFLMDIMLNHARVTNAIIKIISASVRTTFDGIT